MQSEAGIKVVGRNNNNLRYAYDTTLIAEREEELKSLLRKERLSLKEESEKAGLKLHIKKWKIKIMASSLITSWQIKGEKVEAVTDFIFMGSKITVDGDCSHEIKKTLAPWKKSYDKPRQSIKKQRHHFVDKGLCIQSYDFFQL